MHFWEPTLQKKRCSHTSKVELAYDAKTNEIVAPTFRQDIQYCRCGRGSCKILRI